MKISMMNQFLQNFTNLLFAKRFGIDKRLAHLSALIEKEITKEAAKKIIKKELENLQFKNEKKFVCEKLDFSNEEMDLLVKQPTKNHIEFGSDLKYINFLFKIKTFLGIKLFK